MAFNSCVTSVICSPGTPATLRKPGSFYSAWCENARRGQRCTFLINSLTAGIVASKFGRFASSGTTGCDHTFVILSSPNRAAEIDGFAIGFRAGSVPGEEAHVDAINMGVRRQHGNVSHHG